MPRGSYLHARRRSLALGVAVLVAVASAVLATSSLAAATYPTATRIDIARVFTPSISVPDTPGAAAPYVVKGVPFTVDITTDYPLSRHKSTRVLLTVTSGPDAGAVTVAHNVPKGATSASITGVVLPTAANQVSIQVAVDGYASYTYTPDVEPGTATFDVLKTSLSAPATSKVTGFGGGGGPGVRCVASPTDKVCGDLQLPESNGVLSNQLLSQGACDGLCNPVASFLQVLVDVDPNVYNRKNPIELVAKCDKSLCGGNGIKSYGVLVQLTPAYPPVSSPPCSKKGVVDAGKKFCTDYVQSHRANAGDLHLMVLLAEDAKIIFR